MSQPKITVGDDRKAPGRRSLARVHHARDIRAMECGLRRLAHHRHRGPAARRCVLVADGGDGRQLRLRLAGTYTRVEPNRLIECRFGDRMAEITFEPQAAGVVVRVSFDPETEHLVEMQRGGWQAILDNFARHVERRAMGHVSA